MKKLLFIFLGMFLFFSLFGCINTNSDVINDLNSQLQIYKYQNNELNNQLEQLNNELIYKDNNIDEITYTAINLNNELNNKTNEIINLNNELNIKNNEITNLNNDLSSKVNELNNKNNEITNLTNELNDIILLIQDNIDFISESQSWFEFNNKIDNKLFIDELYNKCVNTTNLNDNILKNNYDIINLECIGQFNLEKGFTYINDDISSNNIDKLQSINEFMQYKNGDCEDYSLFFKAEYNSLKDKTTKEIITIIGKDETNYYYTDNNIMVMVCGYSINNGHCEVALIENNINDLTDVRVLLNGFVIEPQDGTFSNIIENVFLFYGNNEWYNLEEIISNNNYIKKYNNKWYDYNTTKNFLQEVIN